MEVDEQEGQSCLPSSAQHALVGAEQGTTQCRLSATGQVMHFGQCALPRNGHERKRDVELGDCFFVDQQALVHIQTEGSIGIDMLIKEWC
jgi:hypothetical protein